MKIRKKRKALEIPLSAMGDIAFLLLIFYMATTMVTDQKPREMSLSEVTTGVVSSPYPLIIYLDKEMAGLDSVYFFNQTVPLANLPELVRERAARAPAAVRVYLNIEKDLAFRYMDAVMEALKRAGVRNMVITTRVRETEGL